jgi:hypothetical protein
VIVVTVDEYLTSAGQAIGHADQRDSLRTISWTGAVEENAMCLFLWRFYFWGRQTMPIRRKA